MPTVFRIAQTLGAEGLLAKTDNGTHGIGRIVARLGLAATDEVQILKAAGTHLRSPLTRSTRLSTSAFSMASTCNTSLGSGMPII